MDVGLSRSSLTSQLLSNSRPVFTRVWLLRPQLHGLNLDAPTSTALPTVPGAPSKTNRPSYP
ncbi:hypothetical protein AUEXF2481DRAFT_44864 [Aureobasidium subglaciale EXF-2481]|uniref:Uncharacterized protein n=1 Tax=Aureobasidium subglaciale (strain EXF-2481) TaxID=1043005 RepID=A0A074Y414_AURSE|nr:uncharacterized protein AUEXF2481DRAFT_44864 [Aureobasidium subglaciale EXF-2481]KEQ90669.1 hypothetical protein AUEXF2481DRAFT_44864 [Aureobasidium subglaciale EXF-2481]